MFSGLAETQHSDLWFALTELSTLAALMLTVLTQTKRDGGQTVCDNSSFPSLALDMGLYTEERMSAVTKSIGRGGSGTAWA